MDREKLLTYWAITTSGLIGSLISLLFARAVNCTPWPLRSAAAGITITVVLLFWRNKKLLEKFVSQDDPPVLLVIIVLSSFIMGSLMGIFINTTFSVYITTCLTILFGVNTALTIRRIRRAII